MKPSYPLQGLKRFGFGLMFALLFVSLFQAHAALAQEAPTELNVREFTVTLEHTLSNVSRLQSLFSSFDGELSVRGTIREIEAHLGNLGSSASQLERLLNVLIDNNTDEPIHRDFVNALIQLEDNAKAIQRLIRPNGISRDQATVNLRDIHFALNNIVSGAIRLKRMLGHTNNNGDDAPEVTLDEIMIVFRHVVVHVHQAQTISHSINPNAIANRESVEDIIEILESAKDESTKLSRMLRAYGSSSDERLRLIRKTLNTAAEVTVEIDRILKNLKDNPHVSNTTAGDSRLNIITAALHHIITELREIRRGLVALQNDGSEDPNATPSSTDSVSGLQRFDLDNNCVITNDEILSALELWISKQIDRKLFMEVVDAWTQGTEICVAPDPVNDIQHANKILIEASQGISGITFSVSGQAIRSTTVEVFGTHGSLVMSQRSTGSRLTWNLRAKSGQPIANGVYFYIAIFETSNGDLIRSEVKKIAVIR